MSRCLGGAGRRPASLVVQHYGGAYHDRKGRCVPGRLHGSVAHAAARCARSRVAGAHCQVRSGAQAACRPAAYTSILLHQSEHLCGRSPAAISRPWHVAWIAWQPLCCTLRRWANGLTIAGQPRPSMSPGLIVNTMSCSPSVCAHVEQSAHGRKLPCAESNGVGQ